MCPEDHALQAHVVTSLPDIAEMEMDGFRTDAAGVAAYCQWFVAACELIFRKVSGECRYLRQHAYSNVP
eukprot:4944353-Pyramimonas_sp.AAC.1